MLAAHPLDLCVLGIGENGHLAFNDPPVADFDDPVALKVVRLDDACRRQQVGEGHFPDVDAVPATAITVTIPALLGAERVMVVAPDARKAAAGHGGVHGSGHDRVPGVGAPDRRPRDRVPRAGVGGRAPAEGVNRPA